MTTKILKCTAVFMCVCLLVTGLFTNVRIEAKTSDTGYTIDVTETEGGTFILEGNTAMVPQGITLLSLQDEGENEFDPYQFQMEVSEEKTYSFVLEFESADGEVKSETIEAMVQAAPKEATESEVAAPASEMQQEQSQDRNAAVLTSTAVGQETSEVQDTQTVPEENQEWVAPSANNFQLETQYADDHSYMEVTLKNISGKDVFDIASVTDSNGNDHTFDASWRLNEEGTYTYEIKYYDNETGEKLVESHQIVVDDLYQPRTVLLSTLQARATTAATTISMYAYYRGTSTKVQETPVNVPVGQISENPAGTAISGFDFVGIYLRKGGEHGVLYKVTSIYREGSETYYTLADDNADNGPSIAYELTQDEELGAYYQKEGSSGKMFTLSVSFGQNVTGSTLIANDVDSTKAGTQVYAGTEVGVRLTYKNNLSTFDILINGQTENYVKKEESKVDNMATYTFIMPEKDVTITGSPTAVPQYGTISLYNADNQYFNSGEVGYTALGTFGGSGLVNGGTNGILNGNVVMAVGSGAWYRATTTNPTNQGTRDPYNLIVQDQATAYTNQVTAANWWVKGVTEGGYVYNNRLTNGKSAHAYPQTNAEGNQFKAPLNSFYRDGNPITFKYVVFRGRPDWAGNSSDNYRYFASNFYIDIFPDQTAQYATGDYFTNNGGNTVVREAIKLPTFNQGDSAVTTLRNGATVTVTLSDTNLYDIKSNGLCSPAGNSVYTFQDYTITVTGMYDDFRFVTSSISSVHKNMSIRNVSGIVTENNKIEASDIVSYIPTKKGDMSIVPGITLTNANESPAGDGVFELILNPQYGYSIPSISKYGMEGQTEATKYGGSTEQFEIVTGKFPDQDGLYHYKYRRNNSTNADRVKYLDISSQLVTFTVDYFSLDAAYKPEYVTQKDLFDAVSKTYFSIPSAIPTSSNQAFGGWYLKVLLNRNNSSSASNDDRYLTVDGTADGEKLILEPNDLVSVSYLYELFASSYMAQKTSDIGHTEYKFEFVPKWINGNEDGAYKSNGQIKIYYQSQGNATASDNFTGYAAPNESDKTLINNLNYILGSSVRLGNYSETSSYNGVTYNLNDSGSLTNNPQTDANGLLGYLVYDKPLSVNYDLNQGTVSGGSSPTDTKKYTTVSGHDSSIQLSSVTPTKNGQKFTGWKIVSGSYSSELYASGRVVDLSTLSADLKNSIYTNGTIQVVAQYQSTLAAVKHTNGKAGGIESASTQVIKKQGDAQVVITETFQYDGNASEFTDANTDRKIHYALYEAKSGATAGSLLHSDVGTTQSSGVKGVIAAGSVDSSGKQQFTVTYTIAPSGGVTCDNYQSSVFRIFAWTTVNNPNSPDFTDSYAKESLEMSSAYPLFPSYVTAEATVIGTVTHSDNALGEKGSLHTWLKDGSDSVKISHTFKYGGNEESFDAVKTKALLHTALYVKNGDNFNLSNTDISGQNVDKGSVEVSADLANGTFTVTYTIGTTPADYNVDNLKQYRIFAWTQTNAAGSFTDSAVPAQSTLQDNYPKVPYATYSLYVFRAVTHTDENGPNASASNGTYGWFFNENTDPNTRQWLYENGESITVSQKFKYDGDSTTFDAAKTPDKNGKMEKLHVALYRQESTNNGGASADKETGIYSLLDTDLKTVTGSDEIKLNISELGTDKTFTVTYTIPKNISYTEDNYDRYAIIVWTEKNDNNNFTDNKILDSINKSANSFGNIPCYSQTVWVMKPYEIIGAENSSNIIARNTLKYKNDNGFTIQQEFKYDNRMSPTEVDSEAITKVNLFKKDASGGNTFLWVGTDINLNGYDENLTDNAMSNGIDSNKRVNNYSIAVDEQAYTFTVELQVLELAQPIYDTGAVWSLMCWNYSNTSENPYEVSSGNKNRFLLKSNYDSAAYPTLQLTTYIITGASIPSAMFNIPATATLYDIGGTTVGNENLQIEIKGVYNNTSGAIVKDDSAVDPSSDDVLHDSNYVVSANSSSGQDPKITMSQGNLSFDVYYYKNDSKVTATDTALGTLGFATNNAQQTLTFAIKGERSKDITTKDPFTGIGNFTITREKISNFVN